MSFHEIKPRRPIQWTPIITIIAIALVVGGFILMGTLK